MRSISLSALGLVTATLLSVSLAGCSTPTAPPEPTRTAFVGHVHGLGVDPADNTLYVAAHGGVFQFSDAGLSLVANRVQDTMGFTVIGPRHFVASGHPAPTDLDRPVHLGLIESTDAAQTWTETSLGGAADFHALEQGPGVLYGYDSQTRMVMSTTDRRTWAPLVQADVSSLAAHPTQPDEVIALTATGAIHVQGRAQTPLATPAGLTFLEWPEARTLVGVTADGAVHRSTDTGTTWSLMGKLPAPAVAFHVTDHAWYAATDQGLYASTDTGQTWTQLA